MTGARPYPAKQGFALPAVLSLLAVLTLVFLTVLAASHGLAGKARAAVDEAEFERLAFDAEARTAFLALVEPEGPDRLRVGAPRGAQARAPAREFPVFLDNRPHAWDGAYLLQMQDEAGLANIDFSRRDTLMRLFQKAQLGREEADALADQLLDYIDADDVRLPRGAEAADYQRAGRPPPPNAKLDRIEDVFGVLDWPRVVDAARWARMEGLISADASSSAFNINTAPAAVLEVVLNLSPAQAQGVLERRAARPIVNLTEVGLRDDGQANSFTQPNGRFRFSLTDPARGWRYQSRMVLTPDNSEQPIWISPGALSGVDASTSATLKRVHAAPFPDSANTNSGG